LTFTLYWQAHNATERPYTVFVHILDEESEQLVAQADSQPVGGGYPTDLWGADEIIADIHAVPLPEDSAARAYRVMVGLYSLDTGQRLEVRDGHGRLLSDSRISLGSVRQSE
jgi:hypothetical protein